MTRFLPFALLTSCIIFVALLVFVPQARQDRIYKHKELIDYRFCVRRCLLSEKPYSPEGVKPLDACYPPVSYCIVNMLATDIGQGWHMSPGEKRLVFSLFVLQIIGISLLVWWIPNPFSRLVTAMAIVLSPACLISLASCNPTGWAFAFVCVYLSLRKSSSFSLRILAAISLGMATSLKLTPCLFGCLYLADARNGLHALQWREIIIAALAAIISIFLPFAFFGGFASIPQWVANALENSSYYCKDHPMWGFVPLVGRLVPLETLADSLTGPAILVTRITAGALVVASIFVNDGYRRLLYIGSAMAFLVFHEYGGVYLMPAFIVWLCTVNEERVGVKNLLEAIAWFLIITPLQFPEPFTTDTINQSLQNESLFLLLILSFSIASRKTDTCDTRTFEKTGDSV